MILYKGRKRTIHIFKIMHFLVQQLKNIVPIWQLRNQVHEDANICVEHYTHPDIQIAHYKKFLTLEARGQWPKILNFDILLLKNTVFLDQA